MPKLTNPDYFTMDLVQAETFLQMIKEIPELWTEGMPISIDEANWKQLSKDMAEKELVGNEDIFYRIYNEKKQRRDKINSVPHKTIKAFLEKYFPQVYETNYQNNLGKFSNEPKNNDDKEEKEKVDSAYLDLMKSDWRLYTFGEKSEIQAVDSLGKSKTKRLYYLKERPVRFIDDNMNVTKKIIRFINSDDVSGKVQNTYEGYYKCFPKKKNGKTLIYLETDAIECEKVNRHLRIILLFGETINEIAIGSFSGIRDGGALFTGAAILVKVQKGDFVEAKCEFHQSFVDKPLRGAIRMLLERRSRSFIKLPRDLENFTLQGLKEKLIKQKEDERKQWEVREVQIYRYDAFVSIPLFYDESNIKRFNNNKEMLLCTIDKLKNEFNLKTITHGIIKNINTDGESMPNPDSAFDSNFDHITQSDFFIMILPEIDFPYNSKNNRQSSSKLSTAFLELGFAWAQRKKIVIICTKKMEEILPNSIKQFKFKTLITINGKFNDATSLKNIIEINKTQIDEFLSTHCTLSRMKNEVVNE
jgi:hypothetical protein